MKLGITVLRKSKIKKAAALYIPLTDKEKKIFQSKLDRTLRQNTLLVYINLNFEDVLYFVQGNRIDKDSSDFVQGRTKALENQRIYKSKTCSLLKKFINILVQKDPSLLKISDTLFASKVIETFNSTNFFACFYYIKNNLNIDGSSELGKQFLKSIYINLLIRVRIQKKASSTVDNQNNFLDFFDEVALLLAYNDIDITDF